MINPGTTLRERNWGQIARRNDLPLAANPYVNPIARQNWIDGWAAEDQKRTALHVWVAQGAVQEGSR